jgi:hypothetical protein
MCEGNDNLASSQSGTSGGVRGWEGEMCVSGNRLVVETCLNIRSDKLKRV